MTSGTLSRFVIPAFVLSLGAVIEVYLRNTNDPFSAKQVNIFLDYKKKSCNLCVDNGP